MDSDLQQYNGTQAFPPTADVGTNADVFLEVTDGPIVTADNNTAQKAPINRSVSRLKDYVLGLRGAIVGDFAGAIMRSVKALQVDLTGGAVSVAPAGTILAQGTGTPGTATFDAYTGDIVAEFGNLKSVVGDLILALGNARIFGNVLIDGGLCRVGIAQLTEQSLVGLKWVGTLTGSGDANPPQGTSIKNQLRAINTPKHWIRIAATGGTINVTEGAGAWSAAIVDLGAGKSVRYRLRITMADAMANATYGVTCTVNNTDNPSSRFAGIITDTMTATQFDVGIYGVPIASAPLWLQLTVVDFDVTCHVMGEQAS